VNFLCCNLGGYIDISYVDHDNLPLNLAWQIGLLHRMVYEKLLKTLASYVANCAIASKVSFVIQD